jgi:hypothetical protein
MAVVGQTDTAGEPLTPEKEAATTKEPEADFKVGAPAEGAGGRTDEEVPAADPTDEGQPDPGPKDNPGEHSPVEANPKTEVDYTALLQQALGLDAIQQEAVIEAICKRFGIPKGALRKRLAELEEENRGDDEEGGTKADVLAELIAEIPVVRGADNRVFGVFGNQAIPVRSSVFKAKIANAYHEKTAAFVSAPTIDKVVLPMLGGQIARAVVPTRFAYDADGSIWIDLGDGRRYVHITKDKVSVETTCPIAFCRPDGMRALPVPTIPKDDQDCASVLNAYQEFLRLDRAPFISVFAWQVGAIRPMEVPGKETGENEDEFAEYTVLKVTGPEGSGKTTLGDYIRRPVDPRFPLHIALPLKVENISISGENGRVLSYDNSSGFGQERSDALSRRATGDGNEVRELFTDRDQTITAGSNPIIITSIADAVTEPDLLSRCLSLDLDKVKQRTPKKKLKANFKTLYPKVVGALCYAVSRALRNLDTTEVPDDIRMQDSAQWALAAAPAAGIERDEVLATFSRSVEQADAIVMEKAIVVALLAVVKPDTSWCGTATDLHGKLTAAYEERGPETGTPTRKLPKDWPDKAEKLTSQLKKLVPTLARAGITVDWKQVGSRRYGRNFTIVRAAEPSEPMAASAAAVSTPAGSTEDEGMVVDEEEEVVTAAGDGVGTASPPRVTAQVLDVLGHGDGGDAGDAFSSTQKLGEKEKEDAVTTEAGDTPSFEESSTEAGEPSPASPLSPAAKSPSNQGDGRGGDGSVGDTLELLPPSPASPDNARIRRRRASGHPRPTRHRGRADHGPRLLRPAAAHHCRGGRSPAGDRVNEPHGMHVPAV